MERVVKVTIEKAPGQILVRNDKGVEWKFDYKSIDTTVSAVAASIATSMLTATFMDTVVKQLDNNDKISFTLTQTRQ